MHFCGSPSLHSLPRRCAFYCNTQVHNMSAAGALLAGTSSTGAQLNLLSAKHAISRTVTSRHTCIVRASVSCKVPCPEAPVRDAWPIIAGLVSSNVPEWQSSAKQAERAEEKDIVSCSVDTSMQRLQQRLPGVPHGMETIIHAFVAGSTAAAAAGQLQRAGFEWAHAMLIVIAWQQALAAQQKVAAEAALGACAKLAAASGKNKREAEFGLEKAKFHLRHTADSFSWQLLKALNSNGFEPGLAYEQLPMQFQLFAYGLLLKCGCLGSCGRPVYRQLPATAAAIRPGITVAVPLQQYLSIVQHMPTIHRHEDDGTWHGDAQLCIHPYQVVSELELVKALEQDMLLLLFTSGGGFAADLAAAAAKVGVIDGAIAAAACSSSSRSLAEILLHKMSEACVGLSAAALLNMRSIQQKKVSSIALPAALAFTDDPNSSHCCLTCECGGAGGNRRGSLTAVASDDFGDKDIGVAGLVPVHKGRSNGQDIECTIAAAVLQQSNNRSRRGLMHRIRSLVGRFCKH